MDSQYLKTFHQTLKDWVAEIPRVHSQRQGVNSHQSRSSTHSSHTSSRHSTVSSIRIKEEQKQAELVVQAAALKKRKEFEQAKLCLKLEEEEFNIANQRLYLMPKLKFWIVTMDLGHVHTQSYIRVCLS
jgi:hypothetical protein